MLCVGLSRNFNHVLKTINMYTFKPAEVTALEEGGNKKARKYWLHFYDAENPREYKVDMEDPKSVLEFMKLKYEAKKWSQHCLHTTQHTAHSTLTDGRGAGVHVLSTSIRTLRYHARSYHTS